MKKYVIILVSCLVVFLSASVVFAKDCRSGLSTNSTCAIQKFKTDKEFYSYLKKVDQLSGYGGGGMVTDMVAVPMMATAKGASESAPVDRVSETNVQVAGVDEADVLKVDGKNIYFAPNPSYRYLATPMTGAASKVSSFWQGNEQNKTTVVKIFPPENMGVESRINDAGDLLLYEKNLAIISSTRVSGYDVTDTKNPTSKWYYDLPENSQIETSRLLNGKLYLVSRNYIGQDSPCPIPLFMKNAENVATIKCTDIYRPVEIANTKTVYTVAVLNPATGQVERKVSLLGSPETTAIYMSKDNLYLTYVNQPETVSYMYGFLKSSASDLVGQTVLTRVQKLMNYDLSLAAKNTELGFILDEVRFGLTGDARLKFDNEMTNRLNKYNEKNKRLLTSTSIVKISLGSLQVVATSKVPGTLLNQFALDEYKGNLRVATTVDPRQWLFGFNANGESVSDVYILNSNLERVGSIIDLGKTERIYSVRFIGDAGYLVTFRQTDPFYVLDLSVPTKPVVRGELKIPGYSGYLHPLSANIILGIGKEGSNVKLSLFDVSSKNNPKEIDKYTLDEYWSEALNNHKAFTQDALMKVFFLPGSKGGYVFSYDNNQLKLVQTVEDSYAVKRAVYVNNYLYVVSDNGVVVFDEKTWERVNALKYDFTSNK